MVKLSHQQLDVPFFTRHTAKNKKGNKMKNVYLFCTKLWVYLIELPVVLIFWIAVSLNDYSDLPVKFYPLIIFSALLILFIAVYFFRFISINNDEIRMLGLFSSRDSALIAENKTLVIALHPHRNIKLELYGDPDEEPEFNWMKSESVAHREICVFRGKAVGGKKSAMRILKYFALPSSELESVFSEGYYYENDAVRVTSSAENEVFNIKIKFKITIV